MAGHRKARGQGFVAFGVFLAICATGTVTGFAAVLPAGAGQLESGRHGVASCQGAPVDVGFDTRYDARLADYAVSAVRLEGLDPALCGGHEFQLAVTDDQGAMLYQERGSTPASGSGLRVNIADAHISAAAAASVRLTIAD
jgi:hypothetical protein